MNRFAALAGALAASWALHSMGPQTALAQEKKLIPITIGTVKIASLTTVWVAKERGMFEKNGLDAKLVEFRNTNDSINAAQSGALDLFNGLPGSAFVAIERGFDLIPVFQNEVVKTAPPDSGSVQVLATSNIRSLKDLVGKRMAVSDIRAQNTVTVYQVLKNAGIDRKSMQFIELPFPTMGNALKAGQVDAIAVVDPFTTQLLTSGLTRVISWNYVESIPAQPVGVMWGRGSYVRANPNAVEAFNRAMIEAMQYLTSDVTRARQEVVSYTGLDAGLVNSMPLIGWDYQVHPEKWQAVADMMFENGSLDRRHKVDEYLSKEIAPYVVK